MRPRLAAPARGRRSSPRASPLAAQPASRARSRREARVRAESRARREAAPAGPRGRPRARRRARARAATASRRSRTASTRPSTASARRGCCRCSAAPGARAATGCPGYGVVVVLAPRTLPGPDGDDTSCCGRGTASRRDAAAPARRSSEDLDEVDALEQQVVVLQHESEQARRAAEETQQKIVETVRVRLSASGERPDAR